MKIVFMGTPTAAVPTLEKILEAGHQVTAVWTQPDRPAGRGNKLKAPPVKELALEHDLEVFQPARIKTRESIELFKSHQADVAVVVAYGRILTKSYLNAYPYGCLNVHFSLLPKYRGAAPVNWAIVRGETETGITTMRMDAGLDTGDILLQTGTAIGRDENSIDLMERLSISGAELLCETLASIDTIKPIPQNDELATYAPLMSKEDGLIDWKLPAQMINNRIRGFQPFPRSYTSYQDQKLTIWKGAAAVDCDLNVNDAQAGEIIMAGGDDLLIVCGRRTVLRVTEIQIEGKRRMNVRDFLNGVNLQVGEVLGG